MNMRYIKYSLLLVLSLLMIQCTEEGDKTYPIKATPQWSVVAEDFVTHVPDWQVAESPQVSAQGWTPTATFVSDVAVPGWSDPDKTVYPTSMTAVVRLSPVLEEFAHEEDRMAAFIGDECRGVAQKVDNNGVSLFFIHVKAPSNEDGHVEFRYYSAALKRTYTSVAKDVKYEIDKIYGTASNPAIPDFEQSGPFPVATKAWVNVNLQTLPFDLVEGDELQAFVGDECRGIKHVAGTNANLSDATQLFWFDILGREMGEKAYFKYYSAAKKQVYISEQTFSIGKRNSIVGTESEPLLLSFVPQGSMTAYLTLDAPFAKIADKNADQVAAFVGGICAGKAEVVGEVGGQAIYKIVINGVSKQTTAVDLRYYNKRTSYVFEAKSCLTFEDGKVEASAEQPFVMPLVLQGKHPLKMTACVVLPQEQARYASELDKMAAFVGDECRGVAKVQHAEDGSYVFSLEINGSLDVTEKVVLKYYSAKNSYLYTMPSGFTFEAGGSYGSLSQPKVLSLAIVE